MTKAGGIVLVDDFGMAWAVVLRLDAEKNVPDMGDDLQQQFQTPWEYPFLRCLRGDIRKRFDGRMEVSVIGWECGESNTHHRDMILTHYRHSSRNIPPPLVPT